MVLVRGVAFTARAAPEGDTFFGRVHVAFYPCGKTLSAQALARMVASLTRQPHTQEGLTKGLRDALQQRLDAYGVIVLLEALHPTLRGRQALAITRSRSGLFEQPAHQEMFDRLLKGTSRPISRPSQNLTPRFQSPLEVFPCL